MRHELRQLRPGAGPERVPDGVVPPEGVVPPKASSPATTTAYAVQPSGSTLRPRSALPLTRSSGTLARPTPASRSVGGTKFPAREGGSLGESPPETTYPPSFLPSTFTQIERSLEPRPLWRTPPLLRYSATRSRGSGTPPLLDRFERSLSRPWPLSPSRSPFPSRRTPYPRPGALPH